MLNNKYKIKSNRESGYGRYDIMMIPKNKEDLGIVIEFKKADVKDVQNLDCLVNRALEQIEYRNYIQELIDGDIQKIMKLGIAFKGKEIMMKKEMIKKYRKM
ncbi:MAG: PD-(D/E)XK nuclease domain-containing protein [Marinisporobacter sp.]|nr:PD-(D/E)XK nuclease domain-containing protein [Marinisporobacter sp.]